MISLSINVRHDNESFLQRHTGGLFFFFPSLGMVTPLLKLGNLTDDQLAGNTHSHTHTHKDLYSQTCTPNWTYHLHLHPFLFLSGLCSHIHTLEFVNTQTHTCTSLKHDKHAGCTVRCPVATATQCLGNQQGWRRLFPDQ